MSVPKHTPGPWRVINGADVVTEAGATRADGETAAHDDFWTICHYDNWALTKVQNANWMEGLPREEADANLALIAAAPRLAEALRNLLAQVPDSGHPHDALRAEIDAARAALREAGVDDA